MPDDRLQPEPLRVLIADESAERLDLLAAIIRGAGHVVVASETVVEQAGVRAQDLQPDVALVAVGASEEHALALISRIVAESECPVIAVLPEIHSDFVHDAAKRGIFAFVSDTDVEAMESSIQIALLRFEEFHGLEGAFGRRAIIEQAKGIVMERHGLDDRDAFEVLRRHARRNNLKIVDVAKAVTDGTLVLTPG